MWRIWMVLRLTLVIYIYIYIYIYVHFVCCTYQLFNCLFIFSMLKNHFVLNGIVEIASVCPMLTEDPSTVVLDGDE